MFGLKKRSVTNPQEDYVSISKRHLTELAEAIAKTQFNEPIVLDIPTDNPLFDILTSINQQIIKQQKKALKGLLEVNGRVERITSITSIFDMIREIQKQNEYIDNMAAQAEQMGAAASQMATTTSNAATFVNQSLDSATAGVNNLQEVLAIVENSFNEFEETNQQVLELLNSLSEIEEIIGLIAGVADQTNLLALNAAIEAARAGEYGRGFAVVADEVRKLAEHTKSSVADIKAKMVALNQSSHETSERISRVAHTMERGKAKIQDTSQSIESILTNIKAIAEDIHQIAAGNEQQSATLQEFGSHISALAAGSGNTLESCRRAGTGINQISNELIKLRQERIKQATDITIHDALEICRTDHTLWVWKIYNMLLGYERIDPAELTDHTACSLSQWLNSPQGKLLHNHPEYPNLDAPHRRFHELVKEAVMAYENGNIARVEKLLEDISESSRQVVDIINELQSACIQCTLEEEA